MLKVLLGCQDLGCRDPLRIRKLFEKLGQRQMKNISKFGYFSISTVCDSMAGWLMKQRKVDAVVVGADRVASNGDTANKIGTYGLAVLANFHGIPFYVAVPTTSIDFRLESGEKIPVEERPAIEMTHVKGIHVAAPGINCWNPAFDVTPGQLITGLVTENGTFAPWDIPAV